MKSTSRNSSGQLVMLQPATRHVSNTVSIPSHQVNGTLTKPIRPSLNHLNPAIPFKQLLRAREASSSRDHVINTVSNLSPTRARWLYSTPNC
jgi:hypothetical protein